ncbi:hypothetical protein [Albirhodobacter sp. R86504]|uniref:hypothetical protein n=1 Tax=Albirhodobacter sp. R86504 TaxID=3093848 RepID=UPI00367274BF
MIYRFAQVAADAGADQFSADDIDVVAVAREDLAGSIEFLGSCFLRQHDRAGGEQVLIAQRASGDDLAEVIRRVLV